MVAVTDVDVRPRPIGDLGPIIGNERLSRLRAGTDRMRALLAGRAVWNINSTETGGGVAEMLPVLIGYATGADLDVRWCVIAGDPGFFEITKRIHNRLHGWSGTDGPLDERDAAHYSEVLRENCPALLERIVPGDVVILHDPQTLGLARPLSDAGACVVWRCHIGADAPNRYTDQAWSFLRPHLDGARAVVVSRAAHLPPGITAGSSFVIPPSIDPLSAKNQPLTPETVAAILGRIGLTDATGGCAYFRRADGTTGEVVRAARVIAGDGRSLGGPLVVQVSRWDRLKDMLGVMRGFARLTPGLDARLALVGPDVAAVTDDPEGAAILDECWRAWHALPDDVRARILLVTLPMDDPEENAAMVNAVQRHACVVVQKSLAEGFGLTVAEAMWKQRPVIGSAVGGIVDQLAPGTGILLDDPSNPAFAKAVEHLVTDGATRHRLGVNAHQRVLEHFLPDRLLLQHAELIVELLDHR